MLVVGNGPSLNETPLDDLVGVPSIGMNKIDMIFTKTEWRPTIVVCQNRLIARQHRENFAAASIPVYLNWSARRSVGQHENVTYFLPLPNDDFSRDLHHGLGSGATVTYAALQFAHFMGADPVVLVGVDHRFDRQGRIGAYEKRSDQGDNNHFTQDYFTKGQYWGLPNLAASETDYARARDEFHRDGRQILDATVGGGLTVFDKINTFEMLDIFERSN